MFNPRDSNNNYEEGMQDVSNKFDEKKAQTDHVEDAPELADDEYEKTIDTDNTKARNDDSCMEISGDKEWVKEYGDIVWSSEDEGTIACAMDNDMGHVVPPGVVQPGEVDITAEEREAGNRRSSTPALSVSSKTQ